MRLSMNITRWTDAQAFYEELLAQERKPKIKLIHGSSIIDWEAGKDA